MLIISLLDLDIEIVGPVFEVVDINGDVIHVVGELLTALGFDVLLVRGDDFVGEEVVLLFGDLLQDHLLFVTYEFVVLLLLFFEVDGVETVNGPHFLDCADLTHLVDVLEPSFVAHG